MANTNSTAPLPPPPPAAGTGPGPVGVPGGTDRSYRVDIIVCAVVTAVIGSVFVALRFYTRRVIVYVLGWEDWLILAAQVSVPFTFALYRRRLTNSAKIRCACRSSPLPCVRASSMVRFPSSRP